MDKLSLLDCFDDYVRSNAVLSEGIEKGLFAASVFIICSEAYQSF